jgi:signal transduction histidine kinase/ABC-type amino acid transport substrate-binding protein
MQFRVKVSLISVVIIVTALLSGQAEAEGQVLRVAFDKAMPPFSSVDENGDVSGFNVDLMRAIAKQNGFELEYYPLEWEDAVTYLQQGKVDVVMGMKYTSSYDRVFDFSESFFTMSEVLLVPKEDNEIFTLNQLKEKVVAVQRGNTGIDLLESVRRVKMLVSFNQQDALSNLMLGRADAFIGNRWTAEYILRKENKWEDYVMRSGLINPTDYAFAVREGNYKLLQTLNEGLNQLYRDGTYTRLYSRYFEPFSPHVTDWWRKLVIGLLVAMGLVVIVLVTIFYWNKRLQAEVKKQTAALANSLAFQRKVLDNTESAILSLDVYGHITLVNQVARRLLQVNDDVLGRSLAGLLPQLPIEAALTAEQPQQYDGEFNWDNGVTRIFHYYIAPFFNAQDEHAGWIVSLQDRTEQKRLQTTLIAQEKMRALGQLVAGIAHELRNPLTAIKAFIDLLPKKLDDQRFRQELLLYVPDELERMNRIVEDLLDYSRSRPLQSQAIALRELIQSVIGLFAKRMQHEQIDVAVHVPPELSIWADRTRVKQVLLNLVLNAVEAMAKSKEKRLTIEAYQDAGGVFLSVSDTGEGMDESELPHLFQPFYTTKTQGIGLGLYLSEKMMREQGGRIEVSSVRGKGSTFTLRFTQIKKEESYAEPVAVGR